VEELLAISRPHQERNAGGLAHPKATSKDDPCRLGSSRVASGHVEVSRPLCWAAPTDREMTNPFCGDDELEGRTAGDKESDLGEPTRARVRFEGVVTCL
jgi:hypothetical protein